MATKIVTKNSSTASAVPTTSDLVQGELAVNVADKRLFTEDNAGAIVELGTNPSTLTVTGEITANGGIALGDNDKATFGAGDDLQIYHNANTSFITESGSSNFKIGGQNLYLQNTAHNENYLEAIANGGVTLYYNNVAKIATTATGINVTGTASATSVTSAQHLTAGSAYSVLFGDGGERISGNNSSSLLNFFTGAAERMRIDSAGNVGVGTTSPANSSGYKTLSVNGTTGGQIAFQTNGSGKQYIFSSSTDLSIYNSQAGNLTFVTNNAERMRILSDGAAAFGCTTSRPAEFTHPDGFAIRFDTKGQFQNTVTNAPCGIINRDGTDGDILVFRKDGSGTAVGSIGTVANRLAIGTGDVGIFFDDLNNRWVPITQTGLADRDAAIDLGYSSSRFKDLYLSGGVYLGGTSAAHKLDDYEEVAFTATIRGSTTEPATLVTVTGFATKIGRVVQYSIGFENVNTTGYAGTFTITGLPFTNRGGRAMGNLVGYIGLTYTGTDCFSVIGVNSTTLEGFAVSSNSAWGNATHNAGSGRYFWLTGTYMTA